MQTHLGRSLLYHLSRHNMKQTELARRTSLPGSSVSELISKGTRPEPASLRALCNCWPDGASNLRVLIEHLRDEMNRAGHADAVELRPAVSTRKDVDRDIDMLARHAMLDADIAAIVRDLATLVRRAMEQPEEIITEAARAADPPALYPVRPRKTKKRLPAEDR